MKYCKNCGTALPEEARFCTNCGTAYKEDEGTTVLYDNKFDDGTTVLDPEDNYVGASYYTPPQAPPIQQPNPYAPQATAEKITLEQFFNKFASKKTKNWHKTIAVICIITAVISLGLLGLGSYFSVIDVIFYMVFGILLFKKKIWIFPLVVTCYGGIFTIIGFVTTGTPSGIFACIAGIMATIGAKKINDAYKVYTSTGQFPDNEL